MSATSRTPVLFSIAALALAKPLLTVGARVAARAITSAAELGVATARALSVAEVTTRALPDLPSVATALAAADEVERKVITKLRQSRDSLSKLDIQKTATIAAAISAPLVANDSDAVQACLAAVEAARTDVQFAAARAKLRETIHGEHGDTWLSGLQDATQRAFEAIGFHQTACRRRSPREIHVTAVNSDGKVLVSELQLAPDGTPSMATEVVNGCGPECEGILTNFEKALGEYVRGAAPVRKPTGGVCQLDAAIDFVRRRVRRAPLLKSASPSKTKTTRTNAVVQKRS
jgi:hypothetical protein